MTLSATVARLLAATCALAFGLSAADAGAASAHLTHLRDGVEISGAAGSERVTALTDSIIRVRIARAGKFGEDASWAVPAEVRHHSVRVTPTPTGFRTAAMELRIDPSSMKLEALDLSGKVISADAGTIRTSGREFELRKTMPLSEHYFGMGDKTGVLDRRGYTFVNWDSDTYGYTPSTDPIYKSIPFFVARVGLAGATGCSSTTLIGAPSTSGTASPTRYALARSTGQSIII